MRTRWSQSRGGFTLIELLLVVAILGIVSAIAVPNVLRYQMKSRQAEVRSSLAGVFIAEAAYFSENSRFGSFTEIGYTLAGNTNRYSYRAPDTGGGGGCPGTGASPTPCYIPAGIGTGGHAADNSVVPSDASNAPGSVGFTATGVADLDGDPTLDQWHVNDLKQNLRIADSNDVLS